MDELEGDDINVEADDDENKPPKDDGERQADSNELLSFRAEIFRSKLMNEFHLLESLGAGGLDASDEPHLCTRDALDDDLCKSMMMKEPNSLIQFQVYSDKVGVVRVLKSATRFFVARK